MYDYRQGLDWRMNLLTTYTHDSELQAITAPPLISTIHKSPQHPFTFSQLSVSSPAATWQRHQQWGFLSFTRSSPLFTDSHKELSSKPRLAYSISARAT
jgi:hypothetical protein